jgi:hypothetical protein
MCLIVISGVYLVFARASSQARPFVRAQLQLNNAALSPGGNGFSAEHEIRRMHRLHLTSLLLWKMRDIPSSEFRKPRVYGWYWLQLPVIGCEQPLFVCILAPTHVEHECTET